jgi:Uncharacterized conserved protein
MSDVVVRVRVTPRADRNAVVGWRASDGVLLLRVSAAPVDGAANRACTELVAQALGVRKSTVTLVGGATARDKRFSVTGLTEAECAERLARLPHVGDGAAG